MNTNTQNGLIIPRVHWNGTSKGELLRQLADAQQAILEAITVLGRASPHGRDYYVISDEAITQARDQHRTRIGKLEEILSELQQIGAGVQAQEKRG